MVGGFLFLQSATVFTGVGFGSVLNNLQQAGLFSYIIPFLLIFSLVFGILSRMNLFKENKAVTAIIALAVGLMSLQLNIVPQFFSQIFPRFGVAIAIILVLLILLGLFLDPKKPGLMYALLIIAAIIVVVVLVQSAGSLGIPIGNWLQNYWGSALLVLIIGGGFIGLIIWVVSSTGSKGGAGGKGNASDYRPYLIRIPGEDKL